MQHSNWRACICRYTCPMLSDELGSQGSLIYKKQAVIALKHSSVIHITAHPQGSYLRPTGRGRIFRRTKKKYNNSVSQPSGTYILGHRIGTGSHGRVHCLSQSPRGLAGVRQMQSNLLEMLWVGTIKNYKGEGSRAQLKIKGTRKKHLLAGILFSDSVN